MEQLYQKLLFRVPERNCSTLQYFYSTLAMSNSLRKQKSLFWEILFIRTV